MSGTQTSPSGNKGRHIEAAHDWLRRAEEQFASGQDMLAASTLILAQAELKILVEGMAIGAVVQTDKPARSNPLRFLPVARTLLGAAALAACFIFGLMLGHVNVGQPLVTGPDTTQPVIQISQAPETEPVEVLHPSTEEAVAGVQIIPDEEPTNIEIPVATETPPVNRPVYRPRPTAEPSPVVEPPVEFPVETSSPAPPSVNPVLVSSGEPGAGDISNVQSTSEISAAEVALRTIRVLSERLLEGDK